MSKINIKELIKGFLIIFSYFIGSNLLASLFLFLMKKNILPSNTFGKSISYLGIYSLLLITYIIIYHKDLLKDFQDFKKNIKNYMYIAFNYWLKGLAIMVISNLILTIIIGMSQSVNETSNVSLLKESFFIYSIIMIILGPIIEELVFRKSFYKFTENKHIYALTTGLIFGGIHIISSLTNLKGLLYLIPYSAVGIAFGYTYKKTNNIFPTIAMHMIHNAINIIFLYILYVGGNL